MQEDKIYILRKTLTIITLILVFATAGLLILASQVKTVKLNYFGVVKNIKTLSMTVEDFLMSNNIYTNDNIQISPSKDTKLKKGMEIKLSDKKELAKLDSEKIINEYTPMVAKIENIERTIPFTEERTNNSTLDRGNEKVVQEGKEGKEEVNYLVRYNDDKETSRTEISSKVIETAQNKVIEVGTKIPTLASRNATVSVPRTTIVDSGFKKYNIALPEEQQKYAYNLCKSYGIQYELFLAVMKKESGYNPNAIGGGNSYGLCQIHISNHGNLRNRLGISNLLDPYDNMEAGAYLLSMYMNSARAKVSGDAVEVYALNSYNMGEGVYFNSCYSKGILNRGYSNSVLSLRNSLIKNGGI